MWRQVRGRTPERKVFSGQARTTDSLLIEAYRWLAPLKIEASFSGLNCADLFKTDASRRAIGSSDSR